MGTVGEYAQTRDAASRVTSETLAVVDSNSRRFEAVVPASFAVGISLGSVRNAVFSVLQTGVNAGTLAPGPASLSQAQVLAIARSLGSRA